MPGFLLLPSPLLPPAAYRPLVAALVAAGHDAELAETGPVAQGSAGAPVASGAEVVRRWAAQVRPGDVLVAHSNAGYLAPAVRAGAPSPMVFLDAALPPAAGTTRLAPPALRDELAGRADADGVLPPWTRWWPRAAYDDLVPAARYAELDAACPRVPLAYLDSEVAAPDGWADGPHAYLALGATYADELAFAQARGWPTRVLAGGHLHLLVDPPAVARAVVDSARSARSAGSDGSARIDDLLARARRRLDRVQPADLAAEAAAGALVVDTRPSEQRTRDGVLPGAVVVDRTQLEWRLDPTSPHRIPQVTGPDLRVVIVCNEGYSSSLAATSLRDLGLHRATDLVGGFQAWRALPPGR